MMFKSTYLDDPLRREIVKNNQHTSVSEKEVYSLVAAVQDMFKANGIPYEVQQAVSRERSPEASIKVSKKGITIKIGITWKTTTVTKFTPKGGIFDEYI